MIFMKKSYTLIALSFALVLVIGLFASCSKNDSAATNDTVSGVLLLKVNPEIAISYDEAGKVKTVDSRNEDAKAILKDYDGYVGKETSDVVKELIGKIGEDGYFVEDVEGNQRAITIELETGSKTPNDKFLANIVTGVRELVSANKWHSPVQVVRGTDYGLSNYADTDYGINNDGDTNYANDTDYGPSKDGITDYDSSSYSGNSGYGNSSGGNSGYSNSSGGSSGYNAPSSGGNSGYDDGNSSYSDSNYGDSNYSN